MAAFRQHLLFSSTLGTGYALAASRAGFGWTPALLSGALCSVAGMLPDLDSDSGRPARELFGVLAAVLPLLLLHRLQDAGLTPEGVVLAAVVLYLTVRFGVAWLFRRLTVHRGMFHSLPAALIAAEVTFLAHNNLEGGGRLILAGAVFLGFLSHLVLDAGYDLRLLGHRRSLHGAAGGPLKLFSGSVPATLFTWSTLALLTYLIGVEAGQFPAVPLQAGTSLGTLSEPRPLGSGQLPLRSLTVAAQPRRSPRRSPWPVGRPRASPRSAPPRAWRFPTPAS
jgi:hypothetical protein